MLWVAMGRILGMRVGYIRLLSFWSVNELYIAIVITNT